MLQNILREAKRLEDNCVNSSSPQDPWDPAGRRAVTQVVCAQNGSIWALSGVSGTCRRAGSVWTKVGFEMPASGSRVFNTEPHSPIRLKRGAVGGIKNN